MKYLKYIGIAVLVLLLDQGSKMWVYNNMHLGEEFSLFDISGLKWLKMHYTLNDGMAFGKKLPMPYGKFILSFFRIGAVIAILFYMRNLMRKNAHTGLMVCLTLIVTGALGNVIDGTFYGVLLKYNVIPGSITPWFHGQVIDMIFTDFWQGILPNWIPIWGGEYFAFPIFNIADSSIFVGVVLILIFQKRFFAHEHSEDIEVQNTQESVSNQKNI
ncbi:MAG: lipoprotein signal peptidase [Raineya sp.]|jgi:signal peptidase II|nr:lipoprotein signal peptidase [Raineya sp.]